MYVLKKHVEEDGNRILRNIPVYPCENIKIFPYWEEVYFDEVKTDDIIIFINDELDFNWIYHTWNVYDRNISVLSLTYINDIRLQKDYIKSMIINPYLNKEDIEFDNLFMIN